MSKTTATESNQSHTSGSQAGAQQSATQQGAAQHANPHANAQQANAQQASRPRSPWEIPFAPFAMPVPDVFSQMMRDQIARTQAAMNELAVYEGVAVQRARTAVDDLARLASDSIGYVGQLAAEWRKLSLETMQRTADAFAPRA